MVSVVKLQIVDNTKHIELASGNARKNSVRIDRQWNVGNQEVSIKVDL